MDGNIEHELVQRREGLDIRNNGRLLACCTSVSGSAARRKAIHLMTEPVHLDRCLLPDEESSIKEFCEAAPLQSCDHRIAYLTMAGSVRNLSALNDGR